MSHCQSLHLNKEVYQLHLLLWLVIMKHPTVNGRVTWAKVNNLHIASPNTPSHAHTLPPQPSALKKHCLGYVNGVA